MAALTEMKHEWRRFKHDPPGRRFDNHRRRLEQQPAWKKALRGAAGFALIAIGVVFCILPGPGTVGIVFGLALLAGMSKWGARLLDRVEPRMRSGLHRAHVFWEHLSRPKRVLLISMTAIVVGLGVVVVWRQWVGPMVAGYLG